jgi:hypothetical protein
MISTLPNTLIGDFEKGGLKMIDIESYFISLKASWVSRLADSKFSNWKLIPLKYLNVFGKIWLIFKMNIPYKFKTLTLYLFFVFFWNNTGTNNKSKNRYNQSFNDSTLPNIERFRFDHDKNKLFIFSIFFSQLSFSHSM